MHILVVLSCTDRKKYKSLNHLKYEDFTSLERLRQRTEALKDFKSSAAEGLEKVREIDT
jgi:hypothetical protein